MWDPLSGRDPPVTQQKYDSTSSQVVKSKCSQLVNSQDVESQQGRGCERRSTHSCGSEHGVPDSSDMLVQQELVTCVSCHDGVDGH